MQVCDVCKKPCFPMVQEIVALREDGGRTAVSPALCNDCWRRVQEIALHLEQVPNDALLIAWRTIANVSKLLDADRVISQLVEPPCRLCKSWRPYLRYSCGYPDELVCCTNGTQYTDFSCFVPREAKS